MTKNAKKTVPATTPTPVVTPAIAKEYNFTLTLQEAQTVIFSLKKQPMEQVEHIVTKMDNQFINQVNMEKALAEKVHNDNNDAVAPVANA